MKIKYFVILLVLATPFFGKAQKIDKPTYTAPKWENPEWGKSRNFSN